MKNKNVLPCVVTVTNDETEVFMEMAINNFRKHLQVMVDCMGNDYERHFKDRLYIEPRCRRRGRRRRRHLSHMRA